MAIDIPVSASFNDGEIRSQISQINSQIKELGSAVAAANKQKFEPVSLRSKEDLKTFVQQTQQLLKLQTELRTKMKETGQGGKMPLAADWAKMYPNVQQRNQKLQEVLGFYGNGFSDLDAPGAPGRRRRPGSGSGGGSGGGDGGGSGGGDGGAGGRRRFWGGITQAGFNAAGPVGQTAGNAVGSGMRGGLGMGLMGLAGGLLALGVGKAVGGVYNKIGVAEDNEIAYDTLKRTLGDVNVAFSQLKSVVKLTGDSYGIAYSEAARLTTAFAKSGNLGADDALGIGGEVGSGIGLSRSYGLDPSQGVGMLGMMRGLGVSRSESDTRRFALLIGETIGKSGAFAKADEVMEALADYATSQTRFSLSENISAYSGQLSSLIGMGIPGLDVQGSRSLMSQVNASSMAGGAKGEASQFFSYGLGADRGLDPFQLQLWREGGSAATLSSVFGAGTTAANFGFKEMEGDETWLGASLRGLRSQYGKKGQEGLLTSATANHFGISMSQAIALQQIQEPDMRQLEASLASAGYDWKTVDSSALSAMGQVVNGTSEQRVGVARELFNRTGNKALSDEDRSELDRAMRSDSAEDQTQTLLKLLAENGQENTQGKDIRDSKALLDNLNTSIAEKLIPINEAMRDGILYLAGGKEMGPRAMMRKLAETEINERYDEQIEQTYREEMKKAGIPFDHDDWLNKVTNRRDFLRNPEMVPIHEKVSKLNAARDEELSRPAVGPSVDRNILPDGWSGTSTASGPVAPYRPGMEPGHGLSGAPEGYGLPAQPGNATISGASGTSAADDALFSALIQQESGGRHHGADGGLLQSSAGALGITQVMPATGRDPGFGVTPLQNDSKEEYMRFGRDYLNALLRYYNGDKRKALAAYNAGAGAVDKSVRNHGDSWLSNMSEETRNYVPSILSMADAYSTDMPRNSNSQSQNGGNITVDPLQLEVSFTGPGTVNAPPQLQTHLGPARPM